MTTHGLKSRPCSSVPTYLPTYIKGPVARKPSVSTIKRISAASILFVTAIAVGGISPIAGAATTYSIRELPSGNQRTYFVNNENAVMGQVQDTAGAGGQHMFIWTAPPYDHMSRPGTLPGTTFSLARAFNHTAQIAGTAYVIAADGHTVTTARAFLYSSSAWPYTTPGVFIDLTTLSPLDGRYSEARGINTAGQVVGSWAGADRTHAFLYSNGVMTDLGSLGANASAVAIGINDSAQIVGQSYSSGPFTHAFLYANGLMMDIGTLAAAPNDYSMATGVNNAGQVIGQSRIDAVWMHGFIYANGTMTDMGTLGGRESTPTQINNAGVVVGYSHPPGDSLVISRAFVYSNGRMSDLSSMLVSQDPSRTPVTNVVLQTATSINDDGIIVASGSNGAVVTYLLLTPVPADAVTPPAPPTPAPPSTAQTPATATPGSGAPAGGSIDWIFLCLLSAGLVLMRVRTRNPS